MYVELLFCRGRNIIAISADFVVKVKSGMGHGTILQQPASVV